MSDDENNEEEEFYGPDYDSGLVEEMKKRVLRRPSLRWDDIAGHEHAKTLIGSVVSPTHLPNVFKGICRPWWKSVLMVGPLGNGKRMLAEAAATEYKTTFLNCGGYFPYCLKSWKKEPKSEKLVRILFQMAKKYAPSTIFINEIDFVCKPYKTDSEQEFCLRAKSELINQINGISPTDHPSKRVIVIASSYYPWNIDDDLWKCMDKRIYIPLPDATGRADLFKIKLEDWLSPDSDLKELANSFCGYSGEDITNVCRQAVIMVNWRRNQGLRAHGLTDDEIRTFWKNNPHPTLSAENLRQTVNSCPRLITKEVLEMYEKLRTGDGRGHDIIF